MERAMGIEPTGKAVPNLENKRFCAMADANPTYVVPGSSLSVVGLRSASSGPSRLILLDSKADIR